MQMWLCLFLPKTLLLFCLDSWSLPAWEHPHVFLLSSPKHTLCAQTQQRPSVTRGALTRCAVSCFWVLRMWLPSFPSLPHEWDSGSPFIRLESLYCPPVCIRHCSLRWEYSSEQDMQSPSSWSSSSNAEADTKLVTNVEYWKAVSALTKKTAGKGS